MNTTEYKTIIRALFAFIVGNVKKEQFRLDKSDVQMLTELAELADIKLPEQLHQWNTTNVQKWAEITVKAEHCSEWQKMCSDAVQMLKKSK